MCRKLWSGAILKTAFAELLHDWGLLLFLLLCDALQRPLHGPVRKIQVCRQKSHILAQADGTCVTTGIVTSLL